MKLNARQIDALKWLAEKPWTTPWWGGKPHSGWPKELPCPTYVRLQKLGLVRSLPGTWSEKTIAISDAGRLALEMAAVASKGA